MGKPLSRPDCLRQNPSCVGKAEEEDLNIDDCYVPQRSIYDTVRLNEQIDSGSKGSLASKHFIATLPYNHNTLNMNTLCGSGVMASSSAVYLNGREINGDVIRGTGTLMGRPWILGGKREPPQHRRSWRNFAPANLSEYGTLCSDGPDRQVLVRAGRGRSMTSSLTSEDDSGLCSPTTEREWRKQKARKKSCPGTRSLSSNEAVHVSGELKQDHSLSSGGQDEFLFSPVRKSVPTFYRDSAVLEDQTYKDVCIGDKHTILKETCLYREGTDEALNSPYNSRSRISGYEELPTAELLDVKSEEELLSVLVTQPDTTSDPCTAQERHVTKDAECYENEQRATESKMADLEDFLLSVEREAGLINGIETINYMADEEIERLLTSLVVCPQMGPMGLTSLQVFQTTQKFHI